jgi:hypothetical protein
MPNARETDIANAIVTHLNAQSLSKTYTCKLDYLPDFEREDLTTAELTVFPSGKAITFASRVDNQYVYTFNLVIRCPVAPAKEPDISAEMYFAEEVIESLDRISMSNASFTGAESAAAYDLDLLNERNEFLAAFSITYLEIK